MTDQAGIPATYRKYLVPNYAPALTLVEGKGCRVTDDRGKEYLDFLSGIAVLSLGHGHPAWLKAVREQSEKLVHVSNLHFNEQQPRLAKMLVERFAEGAKCFFCNSGAEANEALIKLARLYGSCAGRYEIIAMRNSFHGRTLATLTATGQDKVKQGFQPLPEGFVHASFNDLESVRHAVTEKTTAVLVEAVQAEGGVIPADPDFLKGLRTLCDEQGLLLLFDDVQCGIGRLGTWFGFQSFGVVPDAFSLAKGLGGGFPIGAMVAGPKVCDLFQPGSHGTTFGGNPLACSAAIAVLETIEEEGILARVASTASRFMEQLGQIAEEHEWMTEVRGRGWLIGVEVHCDAKALEALLFEEGLITVATAGNVIRFVPPLIVEDADVDEAATKFRAACAKMEQAMTGVKTT